MSPAVERAAIAYATARRVYLDWRRDCEGEEPGEQPPCYAIPDEVKDDICANCVEVLRLRREMSRAWRRFSRAYRKEPTP